LVARPIRIEFAGAVYHVTARGNERREIFWSDEDRILFLKTLAEAVERFNLRIQAYCLMPNHFHLIVETPSANLSRGMGWLQTTYTIRFNRKHRRSGHLFQGRFKAHLVDGDAYARVLVPYVHLNPVRPLKKSGTIALSRRKDLEQYSWSSHRVYAGKEKAPVWLDMGWFHYWDRSPAQYQKAIASYFGREIASPWEELRQGLVLGGEKLMSKVEALLESKPGKDERQLRQGSDRKRLIAAAQKEVSGAHKTQLNIWIRSRLGGERGVDIAREHGFKDGSAITQIVKRLEKKAEKDQSLSRQLTEIKRKFLSSVKS
jgi:REP element-mobilizing transposase RayT